jgi:hypothetical protein
MALTNGPDRPPATSLELDLWNAAVDILVRNSTYQDKERIA